MATVALLDGTLVDSSSEEWRHECECRAFLGIKGKANRQAYLYGGMLNGKPFKGVRAMRGDEAVKRMEQTIMALWRQRKQDAETQSAA